jgi:cyclophilin family peptidyl-prolyl cis-trans isomerase/HEAT repeat protein
MKHARILFPAAVLAVLLPCCSPDRCELTAEITEAETARDAAAPVILKGLAHDSPEIRARAVRALGRIQSPDSVEPIARAVSDGEAEVAREALFALGQLGMPIGARTSPLAVEVCTAVLDSPDVKRVALAVECLGKQASMDSAPRLGEMLEHQDARVRVQAAHALMRLRFVPYWRKLAKEPPRLPEETVLRLAAALSDREVEVRRAAAHAFSRYGQKGAERALLEALRDEDELVRLYSCRALGRTGNTSTWKPLLGMLQDGSPGVRSEVVRAFGDIGAPYRLPPSLAEDPSIHVRAALAGTLGGDTSTESLLALRKLTEDESTTVVAAAIPALAGRLGESFADELAVWLEDGRWQVRASAARAAGSLWISGIALLKRAVTDPEPRVRAAALDGLADLEDHPRARPLIEKGLSDSELAIRGTAVERLVASSWDDRVERLAAVYDASPGVRWIEIRESVVGALAGVSTAEKFLKRVAEEDPAPSVRSIAARALSGSLAAPAETPGAGWSPPRYGPCRETEVPNVFLETDRGILEIRLFPEEAPYHVSNFVGLVREGFYDGLTWHRVVPNFVIQGGDPDGSGWGGPGWMLPDEINRIRYTAGTLGMPKAGKDTGGCQLFITHIPTPHLDGNYTAYGRVVSGLDVIERIEVGDTILRAWVKGEKEPSTVWE